MSKARQTLPLPSRHAPTAHHRDLAADPEPRRARRRPRCSSAVPGASRDALADAREEIEAIYLEMQLSGTISPRSLAEEAGFAEGAIGGVEEDFFAGEPDSEATSTPDDDLGERAPAEPHRGRGEGKSSLRRLFLRIASAVHPDKAQDAAEKARRTELMKELNRAYRDGDAARIFALEKEIAGASAGELVCDCFECQRFRADPLAAIADVLAEVEMRKASRPRRPSPQGKRASRKGKRQRQKQSRRRNRR